MTRVRLELGELVVSNAPERADRGPGLLIGTALGSAGRLDVDDAELLRNELELFLEERGRRG